MTQSPHDSYIFPRHCLIFARRAVVHYTRDIADDWALILGLEAPDITIDKFGDPNADARARAPDGGFNLRWTSEDRGHVQLSSIFRSIGIDGEVGSNDDLLG